MGPALNVTNRFADDTNGKRFSNAQICLVTLCFLAGCQTVKSSHCAAFDAIRPSQAQIDVMTDAEVERMLIELEKFRRLCGVKP